MEIELYRLYFHINAVDPLRNCAYINPTPPTYNMAPNLRDLFENSKRPLLFYHQDGDGISSAALFLKAFPHFETFAREGPMMDDDFVKWIYGKRPDVVVFLDLPVDQEWRKVEQASKLLRNSTFVVIDHHTPDKNMNSENIVHINPRFENKSIYQPTSYLVYNLLSDLGYMVQKHMWVAAIGVISDYAIHDCNQFLEDYRQRFKDLVDTDLDESIIDSKTGHAAKLISAAITAKGLTGAKYALETLVKAPDFYSFVSDIRLGDMYESVKNEVDAILKDFEKNKKTENRIIFYEVQSPLNIVSLISSILAKTYPENIITIYKKSAGGWKISARWQHAAFDIGDIIKKAAEGIGMGGGHERAAGAMVKDIEAFKSRMREGVAAMEK